MVNSCEPSDLKSSHPASSQFILTKIPTLETTEMICTRLITWETKLGQQNNTGDEDDQNKRNPRSWISTEKRARSCLISTRILKHLNLHVNSVIFKTKQTITITWRLRLRSFPSLFSYMSTSDKLTDDTAWHSHKELRIQLPKNSLPIMPCSQGSLTSSYSSTVTHCKHFFKTNNRNQCDLLSLRLYVFKKVKIPSESPFLAADTNQEFTYANQAVLGVPEKSTAAQLVLKKEKKKGHHAHLSAGPALP